LKTLFQRLITSVLLLMFLLFGSVNNTQEADFLPENLKPITPQNMHLIQQLAMLGTGTIESIAWSPDSQQIAAAGSAGIRLFDVNHLEDSVRWLTGHRGKVNDAMFSTDGSQLMTLGNDQTVRQWDVRTGQQLSGGCPPLYYNDERCFIGSPDSIALSPDGSNVALGLSNGMVVLNVKLTKELFSSTGESSSEIQFTEDGNLLASVGFRDGDISIWQRKGSTFDLHQEIAAPFEIWDFAFSPDGSKIALAAFVSFDVPGVQVFDVSSGKLSAQFNGGYTVSIDRTGTLLATSSALITEDQPKPHIQIWNLETEELITSLPAQSGISQIRFSPDGLKLAVGYIDGGVDVWSIRDNTRIGTVEGWGAAVRQVALLEDQLVSLDGLGFDIDSPLGGGTNQGDTIRLWDLSSGRELQVWRGKDLDSHLTAIGTFIRIPNTSQFVLQRENDSRFYIWDIETNNLSSFDAPSSVEDIVVNHSGDQLVTLGRAAIFEEQIISVWSIIQNNSSPNLILRNRFSAAFAEQHVITIALHPTKPEIFGITSSGEMQIWNTESGEVLQSGLLGKRYFADVSYSPNGDMLVFTGLRYNFFDSATLKEMNGLTQDVYADPTFNENGTLIASVVSGNGGFIKLADVAGEYEEIILPESATQLIFSPDDRLLISIDYNGTIRFWGIPAK
jgi:WD40 repeat protein